MIIGETEVVTRGRLLKTAKLRNEWYDFVTEPEGFIKQIRDSKLHADLFTFLGEIPDPAVKHPFYHEWETVAVLPITTYDNWWKKQISDKSRNMARKAGKKGVEVKVVEYTDEFVRGIMGINDEAPIRQSRPFWHYRADFETTKRGNGTYLEKSHYIGAYLGPELIGYIKLVVGNGKASLMQILSKIAHRDKAPTNAMMAKAVEVCAQNNIPLLHYALWSRRGLGDFKQNQAFEPRNVPRYFVPLNQKGKVMLKLRLHHRFAERFPEQWRDKFVELRSKWYAIKHRPQTEPPASVT